MKKIGLILSLCLLCPGAARADFYFKAKTMGGQMEMENWTSGKKQRIQTAAGPHSPMAQMGGEMIVITRVDKGVEWTADPVKKIYQERPIALPYTKTSAAEETALPQDMKDVPSMIGEAGGDCTPVLKEVGEKTFAGYSSKGYVGACKEGVSNEISMIVWVAPPKGDLAKMDKEAGEFAVAQYGAMYANFPPAERRKMEESARLMRDAFAKAFAGLGDAKPKGVPLAMEMPKGPEEGMGGMFYETVEVKAGAVNPAVFDIPPGYVKVNDVMKAKADDMMRRMGVDPDEIRRMTGEAEAKVAGDEE